MNDRPPSSPPADRDEMREALADLAHDMWAGWMKYMFSKNRVDPDGTWTMPREFVKRWVRQMNTPYSDLSEKEKDSDRAEANRMIEIISSYTTVYRK